MRSEPINAEMLEANGCFGCGHNNPKGLQIDLFKVEDAPGQIIGTFRPTDDMVGFPGVVHGGAIYTALDCLATWVATINGSRTEALWLLKKAEMEYHAPAQSSEKLKLRGSIDETANSRTSMTVRVEATRVTGEIVASGVFHEVAVPTDRFLEITERDHLPENWESFLALVDRLN